MRYNQFSDSDWGDQEADRRQQELLDREVRGEFDYQMELPLPPVTQVRPRSSSGIIREGTG